jgi:hypothetical protein
MFDTRSVLSGVCTITNDTGRAHNQQHHITHRVGVMLGNPVCVCARFLSCLCGCGRTMLTPHPTRMSYRYAVYMCAHRVRQTTTGQILAAFAYMCG